jgi:ring-1,2-phenylacetyl-CoA epoxidase subunit PaaD
VVREEPAVAPTLASATHTDALTAASAVAAAVLDPEIPFVTIADLGILRSVEQDQATGRLVVSITPTYSGCPAIEAIQLDVETALADAGWPDAEVRRVLSPAWTTDSITPEGRRKLERVGIAPPAPRAAPVAVRISNVICPRCGSEQTELVSAFGATPCKALWRCTSCLEPFDHFKTL